MFSCGRRESFDDGKNGLDEKKWEYLDRNRIKVLFLSYIRNQWRTYLCVNSKRVGTAVPKIVVR